jgi:hypothetical protein
MKKVLDWSYIGLIIGSLVMLAVMFTSCTTERKARNYMNDHELVAADYCAVKYPVKTDSVTTIIIDSAGKEQEIERLLNYSDSVTNDAIDRNIAIMELKEKIDSLNKTGSYSEAVIADLNNSLMRVHPTDVNALRKSIEAKVRAEIKPCYTITHTITIENIAAKRKAELLRDAAVDHDHKTQSRLDFWRTIALISMGVILLYIFGRVFLGRFIK